MAQQVPAAESATEDSTKTKKDRKPEVFGYIQVFFKARREANGDGLTEPSVFRDQRVRIGVKGKVSQHVGYNVEIDPRAPDITGILRDGFITLDYLPHQEIRIGQQKTQFGYENSASSSRLFVVNRSEVSDGLGRGINLRDIGVGLVGFVRLGGGFRLENAITLVNGSGLNVQADSTKRKNVWGRLGLRYKRDSLIVRVGASGASGDQREPADPGPPATAPFTFSFTRLGAGLEVTHPRLFLAAEYVTGKDQSSVPGVSGRQSGYYAIVAGKTRWGVGPILRYDRAEEFKRWTVGAYAGLPSEDVSLLLNYEMFRDDLGKHDDRFYVRLQTRF